MLERRRNLDEPAILRPGFDETAELTVVVIENDVRNAEQHTEYMPVQSICDDRRCRRQEAKSSIDAAARIFAVPDLSVLRSIRSIASQFAPAGKNAVDLLFPVKRSVILQPISNDRALRKPVGVTGSSAGTLNVRSQ